MEQILCPWEPSTYLFFSSNVPSLVHYSHAVAILAALAIGFLIFFNNPRGRVPRLLLVFVSLFSVWAFLDLVLWATNRPDVVMFSWSLQVLIEPLTYMTAFYIFYLFLFRTWPSVAVNIVIALLLLPIISLLHSTFTLEALYLSSCEATEGPIAKYYTYALHALVVLAITAIGVRQIPRLSTPRERNIAFTFGLGLVLFLLAFSFGTLIGSFTDDWEPSQYGLFGMPIFAGLIAYSVIQFRAFNTKVLTAQILVVALGIGVLSLVALQEIHNVRLVAAGTFLLVCTLGYVLVRSVIREVEQREQIQALAENLKIANEKLKELDKLKSQFLSIASHDLRSPLTAIRNFISLLLDGTFGKLPQAAEDGMQQVFDRATGMAKSIETYLNVSRIEQGRMEYSFEPTDIIKLVSDSVAIYKINAEKKGLALSLRTPADLKTVTIKADVGKMQEVMNNLIDNSIKYTTKGSIEVIVEKLNTTIRITVKDTGAGMSRDTIDNKLFKLFSTAEDSLKMNATSTGVGMYITKAHVVAHKGKIWAESEGVGRGSSFIVELPIS